MKVGNDMGLWLCKYDLSKECEGKYRDCTDCVLDKIKAEIEERKLNSGGEPNRELAFNVCLKIIDKYKAESEANTDEN
jgi:hypothetical protein